VPLAVRVGLHTGLVVVGARGAGERQAHRALGRPLGAPVPALLGQQNLSGQTGRLRTPREGAQGVHPPCGLRVDTKENML
jgi:hypothetical protein